MVYNTTMVTANDPAPGVLASAQAGQASAPAPGSGGVSDAGARLDPQRLAARFGRAIAYPTISRADPAETDSEAFEAFHAYLRETFPLVHATLICESIGEHHALLFTWTGTDREAAPWLLVSHQDVVGIEPGTEQDWSHPPFSGAVADGFIWGRGTIDVKLTVVAALEAAEHLIAGGFAPRRTIYFAFGADEEVGGRCGAALIAATLLERGVRLAFTLDEGGMVLTGAVPGVTKPVALIGTAEKGYATLKLSCRGEGGHSSMPPANTAVARLVRLLHALDRHHMPAALDGPTLDMLVHLAPVADQPYRSVLRNLWLTAPVLLRALARTPAGNAAVRSTLAPTKVHIGLAENVIPQVAEATINVRTKPGDRVADAVDHVARLASGEGIDVAVTTALEATAISPCDGDGYRVLARTIERVMPGVAIAPFLTLNGTDSHQYAEIAAAQYRFVPLMMKPDDLERIHGVNERIAVDDYGRVVRFFVEFLQIADTEGARAPRNDGAPWVDEETGRPRV